MTVAVMKTKAEQGLTELFERVAASLPGGPAVNDVRKAAIGTFASLGLPHRRIEEYKYTDLRVAIKAVLPISSEVADGASPSDTNAVTVADVIAALGPLAHVDGYRVTFVNGRYRADLSDFSTAVGCSVTPLSAALSAVPADGTDSAAVALARPTGPAQDATIALNTALMTDGAVITIASHVKLDKPVVVAFVRAGSTATLTTVRNVIATGVGCDATVIEAHVAVPGSADEGQTNALTELTVGHDATITHIKVAVDDSKIIHLANWNVSIGRNALYRGFQFTSGQSVARNQIHAVYQGEGSKLDISGVFLVRGTSHIDTTLVVDHAVPHCESRELFKGVLDDQGRGVFQGKVIVRPDAQKTDGKQMAQALMLSETCEFDSKPELEIYADDVVCGHGTTSAQLDDDLLFYCMSRGIPRATARALLIESFVGEAIDKVENASIRDALTSLSTAWLQSINH